MPNNLLSQVETTIKRLRTEVERDVGNWQQAKTPAAFRAMEIAVHALFRRFADEVSAKVLERAHEDAEFQAKVVAAARTASAGLRNAEVRTVEVKLLGGSTVKVKTPYLAPQRRKSKRKQNRRRRKV